MTLGSLSKAEKNAPSSRHSVRQRTAVHVQSMMDFLLSPRGDCKPVLGIPPSVEWADGMQNSGDRELPPDLLSQPPEFLEPVSRLGRVRSRNSLQQPTTGLTPFQCVLGDQAPLFLWAGKPSDVPSPDHWLQESERDWDESHHHLQRAVRRQRIQACARWASIFEYQTGQLVWLSTQDIRMHLSSKKASPRYIGPFPIVRQINPVTYLLKLWHHFCIHPTFHVSLLKPFQSPQSTSSTEPGQTVEPLLR